MVILSPVFRTGSTVFKNCKDSESFKTGFSKLLNNGLEVWQEVNKESKERNASIRLVNLDSVLKIRILSHFGNLGIELEKV